MSKKQAMYAATAQEMGKHVDDTLALFAADLAKYEQFVILDEAAIACRDDPKQTVGTHRQRCVELVFFLEGLRGHHEENQETQKE